jgi:hypothetical protein
MHSVVKDCVTQRKLMIKVSILLDTENLDFFNWLGISIEGAYFMFVNRNLYKNEFCIKDFVYLCTYI